jgi:hypothetical protein
MKHCNSVRPPSATDNGIRNKTNNITKPVVIRDAGFQPDFLLKRKNIRLINDHSVCVCVCVWGGVPSFKFLKQPNDFHET